MCSFASQQEQQTAIAKTTTNSGKLAQPGTQIGIVRSRCNTASRSYPR
jgi:hypothetical protein